MKQLLLRVPDELHRRIADQAARRGTSANRLAATILDAAVDRRPGEQLEGRQARLNARAAGLGIACASDAPTMSMERRSEIIASTRGTGVVVDELYEADRARL